MTGTSYPVASAIGIMPDGQVLGHILPQTDFAVGNGEFFDPSCSRVLQLRPMIASDVGPDGMGQDANAILWARDDFNECCVVYYVRLPPHLRKNNRAGVMRAVKYVESNYGERGAHMLAVISSLAQKLAPEVARARRQSSGAGLWKH